MEKKEKDNKKEAYKRPLKKIFFFVYSSAAAVSSVAVPESASLPPHPIKRKAEIRIESIVTPTWILRKV